MNIQDEIWKLWRTRVEHLRTSEEAIQLADETRAYELRLSRKQNTHYQRVIDLVRCDIRG